LVHLTPQLCRAARALLNWPQVRLAAKAELSESTVRDFENEVRTPPAHMLARMRQALEDAGLVFIAAQVGQGPGVRLKTADPARPSLAEGEAGIIANSEM